MGACPLLSSAPLSTQPQPYHHPRKKDLRARVGILRGCCLASANTHLRIPSASTPSGASPPPTNLSLQVTFHKGGLWLCPCHTAFKGAAQPGAPCQQSSSSSCCWGLGVACRKRHWPWSATGAWFRLCAGQAGRFSSSLLLNQNIPHPSPIPPERLSW